MALGAPSAARRRLVARALRLAALVPLAVGYFALPGAAASYSGVTTSPGNALTTSAAFTCASPSLSGYGTQPKIYYSFSGAGTTESNRGTLSGQDATLANTGMRAASSCPDSSSLYVAATTDTAAAAAQVAHPVPFTQAIWFKPSASTTGPFVETSQNTTGTSGNRNSQIYIRSDGKVGLVFTDSIGTVRAVSVPAPTMGAWNLAVENANSGSTTLTVYDASGTPTTASTPYTVYNGTAYSRIGHHSSLDTTNGGAGPFTGYLDEYGYWDVAMSASTIYGVGH